MNFAMDIELTPVEQARYNWTVAVKRSGFNLAAIARELGISKTTIYNWNRVPEGRVEKFSEITGIKKHVLRPDLYQEKGDKLILDDVLCQEKGDKLIYEKKPWEMI